MKTSTDFWIEVNDKIEADADTRPSLHVNTFIRFFIGETPGGFVIFAPLEKLREFHEAMGKAIKKIEASVEAVTLPTFGLQCERTPGYDQT